MVIYKLTNKFNGKIYIGLTSEKKGVNERCRKRIAEAKYRKDKNSYILNAIRKYGEDSFIVEEIDKADSIEELRIKEIFYIKFYNSTDRSIGYNLTDGGEGNKGLKMSESTKNKIRQKAIGRKVSQDTKIKMSKSRLNKVDLSISIKNCRLYNLKVSKKIEKLNINKEVIKIYNSISELAKEEKLNRSGISTYLNLDNKDLNRTYKGFIYRVIK